ncbi:MAG: hypothetical protein PHV34_06975 [Verrucomicrobiae bacterium]|nr:hypothetical protein [Verrucomicrobiae bacterium]
MNFSWRRIFYLLVMMAGLPAAGMLLAGRSLAPYLEFPSRNCFVAHAGFSWLVFALIGVLVLACALPFVLRYFAMVFGRKAGSSDVPGVSNRGFPWWGWLGVGFLALAWILAWTRFSWFAALQRHTFTPLWIAYVVVVNALTWRRTGRCLLTHSTGRFLVLFPCSAAFWWLFEYLNRYVQNWHYTAEQFSAAEYFWYATLPFSTVLPAVLSTREWLLSFPGWQRAFAHAWVVRMPRSRLASGAVFLFATLGLMGIGIFPNGLYPLLWVSPLLLMLSWQTLAGEETPFHGVAKGDWREVVGCAVAALICGWFWEMWNYYSLAKWFYTVPYVNRFHVFEMPLLGFAGYLPFGLECMMAAAWLTRTDETTL